MGIVAVFFGGLVGFSTFVISLIFLDYSFFQALAAYSLAGSVATGLFAMVCLLGSILSARNGHHTAFAVVEG